MRPNLEELRRLHEAATPGPWMTEYPRLPGGVYSDDATGSIVARTSGKGFEYAPRPDAEWQANADIIAAARNAIPWLLDEIARLTAENAALREGLAPFAAFAPEAEAFVQDRATNGGSPIMPTSNFRLADFQRAARLTEPKETENG